ncbi:DUF3667 domain-containing protein [Chryseobacterium gossypii]|uniref:DUF3667 domain-containing protein n=1 Tax=Chryseobacterium gossypii TaxID=3231602 RepID=UPI003524FB67
MSHGKLREDKTCLNCGHVVDERFCTHCGQENTETRQPFYYLFTHFIEDFTHYDGQFWQTIKNLLFKPGRLTREYLAGKRQMYVAPVKLYIFVSFITFFVPAIFPELNSDRDTDEAHVSTTQEEEEKKQKILVAKNLKKALGTENDSMIYRRIQEEIESQEDSKESAIASSGDKIFILGAKNMKQYDSLQKATGKDKLYTALRPYAEKTFHLQEKGMSKDEINNRFKETFVHTLPKALFIYLPIFAFFLWLFHNKKKWWYFDHGIFTLHYFSFLLLGTLIFILGERITAVLPDNTLLKLIFALASTALFFYMCIYFFVAHHRVYETRKRMSILKGSLLFIVNFIGLLAMFILLIYASFFMLH